MGGKQTKTLTIGDAFQAGVASQRRGDWAEAEGIYGEIVKAKPDFAEAHNNLGVALKALDRPEEAIESYRRALAVKPDYGEARNNLARTLKTLGRHEEAVESYRGVVAAAPAEARAHVELGESLQALERHEEAVASFRRALATEPDNVEAYCSLGNALRDLDRHQEAAATYREALAIQPGHAGAHNNLGVALQALNRHREASESFRRALAIAPDYPEAHINIGLSLLTMGDFENGWREYEWRGQPAGSPVTRRTFNAPPWDGSPLAGASILLHAEQGVGDIIQFCRYVPIVARAHPGAKVMFELDSRLVEIARASFGARAEIHPYKDPVGSNLPPFDVHASLMSLPDILGTTLEHVPADIPYLVPAAPPPWRPDGRYVVGLSWFSSNARTGAMRSIPLIDLAPLAAMPGVRFVTLQYGDTTAERRAATESAGFVVDAAPGHDFLADLVEFTSHVAACDLVISIDNTTVHMAGALGRPVWTLLPTVADWRWMLDREDTPWYPTMRLFRQRHAGDWDDVIDRVRDALATHEDSG